MSAPKIANADQAEAWNGTTGVKWVRFQDRLDRMMAPFRDALLDAAGIKAGDTVLDIGCGCGATTLEAAKRVGPEGRTHGVDLSGPMTARARERSQAANANATFEVADASAHVFSGPTYNHLISRFGIMFFDDPVAAFANLHKALSAKGRMTFICWRAMAENNWLTVPMKAVLPLLPPLPPAVPNAPGPFAFADKDRVHGILAKAGFHDISFTPLDIPLTLGQDLDTALEQALEIGPASRLLADQDETTRHRAETAMREELAKRLTPDGVTLAGAAWIVTAAA